MFSTHFQCDADFFTGFFGADHLVTVDTTPGGYVVQGAGVGADDLEHLFRCDFDRRALPVAALGDGELVGAGGLVDDVELARLACGPAAERCERDDVCAECSLTAGVEDRGSGAERDCLAVGAALACRSEPGA